MPDVAVVIPARDAAATLPAALRAVAAQQLDGEVELVVVDDGSADDTAAIAQAAGARVLRTGGAAGPGAARALGVAATTAPVLAFTDADCAPAPGWLAAGLARVRVGANLVQGPVVPDPAAQAGPFDRTLTLAGPSPLFEAANLLVTREAYERAGGFPGGVAGARTIEKSFGEDTRFGWSAVRSGARTAFAPDAVVHHAVFPRGAGGFVAERRRLRLFPALVREVPELRGRLLVGRVFLSRRSAAFDLALAGAAVAAARRRPAPLLLALPWLTLVGPPWPPARWRVRRLAADAAADAVGLASLIEGSARARTPVL